MGAGVVKDPTCFTPGIVEDRSCVLARLGSQLVGILLGVCHHPPDENLDVSQRGNCRISHVTGSESDEAGAAAFFDGRAG